MKGQKFNVIHEVDGSICLGINAALNAYKMFNSHWGWCPLFHFITWIQHLHSHWKSCWWSMVRVMWVFSAPHKSPHVGSCFLLELSNAIIQENQTTCWIEACSLYYLYLDIAKSILPATLMKIWYSLSDVYFVVSYLLYTLFGIRHAYCTHPRKHPWDAGSECLISNKVCTDLYNLEQTV